MVADERAAGYRRRLLAGLAAGIERDGYRATTVADVVRHARTSRRTFYQHFPDKEACFAALLADTTAEMVRRISAAVDPSAPWRAQVRQAVEAWAGCVDAAPALVVSWIRDVPALGPTARRLQHEAMEAFIAMVLRLCDTPRWRDLRSEPVPRDLVVMLLGGLRELSAVTIEGGRRMREVTEVAVRAATALLGPQAP
ncbi:TetR family transcriptional regulator [Saccharothrix syringae]|uniref:TetR family transcriptional regulator n=1 Tax=Saccharothrix syringae TaxID=103733 RepID=A0A5Q0HDR7_SACSY|nr:TetR family transcriptional regulator [Saccharothrix syringae]